MASKTKIVLKPGLLPPNDLPNVYLIIAHGLRQAGGEEPGQEVLGGGVTAHFPELVGEGAGAVPGQRQGGGQQQQQREHGYTLY